MLMLINFLEELHFDKFLSRAGINMLRRSRLPPVSPLSCKNRFKEELWEVTDRSYNSSTLGLIWTDPCL